MNKIILIEDNDDDVLVIRRGFKKSKILNEIIRFVNGKEALEYLQSDEAKNIEIILLDLNMEVMNGFEFLSERQKSDKLRIMPVVVLTSSHRQKDIDKSYALGANAYVEKPLDPKNFMEVILSIEDFWLLIAKKPEL